MLARYTNNYDAASRLLTVSDGTNAAAYSYLANSPLVDHIVFASNSVTTMTTSNSYDMVNRRTAVTNANGSGGPLDLHRYAYNTANQRTSATNVDGSYWVYGYDSLGQVTNGVKKWSDTTVVAGQQFGYGFDTIGNRTMTLAGGDSKRSQPAPRPLRRQFLEPIHQPDRARSGGRYWQRDQHGDRVGQPKHGVSQDQLLLGASAHHQHLRGGLSNGDNLGGVDQWVRDQR